MEEGSPWSSPPGGSSGGGEVDAQRHAALALVADLEAEWEAILESTAASPDDEHDAEGSTVGYERARVASLLSLARERAAALAEVEARRRAGSFGRCEACGGAIAAERLEALPTTRHCIECASSVTCR